LKDTAHAGALQVHKLLQVSAAYHWPSGLAVGQLLPWMILIQAPCAAHKTRYKPKFQDPPNSEIRCFWLHVSDTNDSALICSCSVDARLGVHAICRQLAPPQDSAAQHARTLQVTASTLGCSQQKAWSW
jgi:hypothetical protein